MMVLVVQEKLLHTMVATEDVEEVEILKARFETFDEEMRANADKVEVVNQLSRQLLQNEHPNAEDVIAREDQLNKKWVSQSFSSAIICPIAIAYNNNNKIVLRLCVRVCIRLWTLSQSHFFVDFHQIPPRRVNAY